MQNYQLAEKLHGQFVDQWSHNMAHLVKENPGEMIYVFADVLKQAEGHSGKITAKQVRKWLADIFTKKMFDATLKAVEMGSLLYYFDNLENGANKYDWLKPNEQAPEIHVEDEIPF